MLIEYLPILVMAALAVAIAGMFWVISLVSGPRRPNQAKGQPYECGMEPIGDARGRFPAYFYLTAMVFIIFDVEAAFLYPWAVSLRSLSWFGFIEMAIFVFLLLVGYVYLWKKGAFEWER